MKTSVIAPAFLACLMSAALTYAGPVPTNFDIEARDVASSPYDALYIRDLEAELTTLGARENPGDVSFNIDTNGAAPGGDISVDVDPYGKPKNTGSRSGTSAGHRHGGQQGQQNGRQKQNPQGQHNQKQHNQRQRSKGSNGVGPRDIVELYQDLAARENPGDVSLNVDTNGAAPVYLWILIPLVKLQTPVLPLVGAIVEDRRDNERVPMDRDLTSNRITPVIVKSTVLRAFYTLTILTLNRSKGNSRVGPRDIVESYEDLYIRDLEAQIIELEARRNPEDVRLDIDTNGSAPGGDISVDIDQPASSPSSSGTGGGHRRTSGGKQGQQNAKQKQTSRGQTQRSQGQNNHPSQGKPGSNSKQIQKKTTTSGAVTGKQTHPKSTQRQG
ncbi:hypothetical protein H0H93_016781 [Arthromyces matolae]|nr:hypothetical protein H0H93_016781 [Arthromyces matolae]